MWLQDIDSQAFIMLYLRTYPDWIVPYWAYAAHNRRAQVYDQIREASAMPSKMRAAIFIEPVRSFSAKSLCLFWVQGRFDPHHPDYNLRH